MKKRGGPCVTEVLRLLSIGVITNGADYFETLAGGNIHNSFLLGEGL